MRVKAVRGTRDITPGEMAKWRYVEEVARDIFRRYGYREIRTPTFEHTELFIKGTGETTDIVEKEMYTFTDKGGRSITLRPEGTPAIVRACLENGLLSSLPVLKLAYIGQMFRYDRPQAGRYREFWQIGVEAFGSDNPAIDAEVTQLAYQLMKEVGLKGLSLDINSIGCNRCRPRYVEHLREFGRRHIDRLCGKCADRLDRNPLRILDCKEERCRIATKEAPVILDYLCDECRSHFDGLKRYLEELDVPYSVNPRIVRGLDYYTRTVFEITAEGLGAQNAVVGGGRYDYLVEQMGGKPTPALGFAAGLDRIIASLDAQGFRFPIAEGIDCFVAVIDEAFGDALRLTDKLRSEGLSVEMEFRGRSLRAQMKTADKLKARFVAIVGGEEMKEGKVALRNMETGEQTDVPFDQVARVLEGRCSM
ncbi:histidine--tRNA ligase [Candidatus Poribacteria bacterium]|nr:histidine--tRNA ligase [Candidatus Poribacteria bacterium]